MSENSNHLDILGQQLAPGDTVAFASHNSLAIGVIDRLTNKMVSIRLPARSRGAVLKYAIDMVKIEGPAAVMYFLKN